MKLNLCLLAGLLAFAACGQTPSNDSEPEPEKGWLITSPKDTIVFQSSGGTDSITVRTSASSWTVSSNRSWLTVSESVCFESPHTIGITVARNTLPEDSDRIATLIFSAPSIDTVFRYVRQRQYVDPNYIKPVDYPSYKDSIAPDRSGMSLSVTELAKQCPLGWNLGNTLEVPSDETAWGNALTTQALADSVYAAGFRFIRIPCSWGSHSDSQAKIQADYMARVKKVVDYFLKNEGTYVMINCHWDNGWLEEHPTYNWQYNCCGKQRALWEQIALAFRDYDERLLFSGVNEVHASYSNPSAENEEVHESYIQTFVDAVRSTGGRNAWRVLICPCYNTNIDYGYNKFHLPTDRVENRLMVEVHYYDPWDYCGTADGKLFWGDAYKSYPDCSTATEADMKKQFRKCYDKWASKGIPVVLGEFSATSHTTAAYNKGTTEEQKEEYKQKSQESRGYYHECVVKNAKNNGIIPVYWDNGPYGYNSSGLFYRRSDRAGGYPMGKQMDTESIKGLQRGAAAGNYPW